MTKERIEDILSGHQELEGIISVVSREIGTIRRLIGIQARFVFWQTINSDTIEVSFDEYMGGGETGTESFTFPKEALYDPLYLDTERVRIAKERELEILKIKQKKEEEEIKVAAAKELRDKQEYQRLKIKFNNE